MTDVILFFMTEIFEMRPHKSCINIDRLLAYLEGLHINVVLESCSINAEPENISLPENWKQLLQDIFDYMRFDYTLHVRSSDCEENSIPIEDVFEWDKKRQNFRVRQLEIGTLLHCSRCRKYLDPQTLCGQYSKVKDQHVPYDGRHFSDFKSSLLLRRLCSEAIYKTLFFSDR